MTDHLFTVDPESRTVEGILLPYGEESRLSVSGAAPLTYDGPDDVQLLPDPAAVRLTDEHNTFQPLGYGEVLEHRPEQGGVFARFRVAKTPAGDAYLADPKRKRKLSPEIAGIIRRGAKGVGGLITGAAVTTEGAWAGAHLFALGDVTEAPDDDTESHAGLTPSPTGDAPEGAAVTPGHVNDVATPDTPADTITTTDRAEAPTGDTTVTSPTIVPDTAPRPVEGSTVLNGYFSALSGRDTDLLTADLAREAGGDMFAISSFTEANGAASVAPQLLGELWRRRKYGRRFSPLIANDSLTASKAVGWQWTDGSEPIVGDYAGPVPADIPSNAISTVEVSDTAKRIAGGHKLDRKHYDFNERAVIESYHQHMIDDYSRKADLKAFGFLTATANVTATAPGAVPAGVAKGLAAIVDGALDVITQSENTPGWALVDAVLWRDIVLSTDKQGVLTYLTASMGLEEGDLEGFKIRPAVIGTAAEAGKVVVVGAKEAATFYELGGGAPIRVEGISPHQATVDPAVFGYWAAILNNKKAIRKVLTV